MMVTVTSLLLLIGTAVHCLNLPQNSVNSLDKQPAQNPDLETLFKELLAEATPIGQPFPSIKGPKKTDKVCIVGAGPAGISMAQSLNKRGYSKLTIFESSDRVGGKTVSLDLNNVTYVSYLVGGGGFKTLVPLAQEYNAADLIPVKWPNMWKTDDGSEKLTVQEFMIETIMNDTNAQSPAEAISRFIEDVEKYNRLYKQVLFGSHVGEIFLRPDKATLFRIRGTIADFLKREGLEALSVYFKMYMTVFGYGHIDEIGAMYGLMQLPPSLFTLAINSILGIHKEPFCFYILKRGFQTVWTNIVKKEKFDIRYNSKVYSIRRFKDCSRLRIEQTPQSYEEWCDFLIWTGTGPQLLNSLEDISIKEETLLSSLKSDFHSVSWINMKNERRNGPSSGYVSTLETKYDGRHIAWEVYAKGLTVPGILDPAVEEAWNRDNSSPEVKMAGIVGDKLSNRIELEDILRSHYEKMNATIIDFIHHAQYDYFNRWSPQSLQIGPHWEVFDLQGERNMWYTGGSFSFDTVHNVMAYNNLLLQQLEHFKRTTSTWGKALFLLLMCKAGVLMF